MHRTFQGNTTTCMTMCVCVDGCCISCDNIITFNTIQSKSDKNITVNRLSEDLNMSMLIVCSISSKLDIPDFTEFIESHIINCFVETKINYQDIIIVFYNVHVYILCNACLRIN